MQTHFSVTQTHKPICTDTLPMLLWSSAAAAAAKPPTTHNPTLTHFWIRLRRVFLLLLLLVFSCLFFSFLVFSSLLILLPFDLSCHSGTPTHEVATVQHALALSFSFSLPCAERSQILLRPYFTIFIFLTTIFFFLFLSTFTVSLLLPFLSFFSCTIFPPTCKQQPL